MKKRLFSAFLVLLLVFCSVIITPAETESTFTSVVMNIGASESQRNLTWYTTTKRTAEVHLALASDVKGDVFPENYQTFVATSTLATNKEGYFTNKATITGLKERTSYVYRLVSGSTKSGLYKFRTGYFSKFTFGFLGDPQFGWDYWTPYWRDSLQKVTGKYNADFLVCAGDQVDNGEIEAEYDYFLVDELTTNAFAPTIGPYHDFKPNAPNPAFSEHYNLPNVSDKYGVTQAGADYWYRYNNALFMHLNSSDTDGLYDEHYAFMKDAIEKNSDAKWRFVVFHNALFSTGPHSASEMAAPREHFSPQLSELGIDVVLSGHDHVYVRSKMMIGNKISDDVVKNNTVTDPKGVLHICANSSSGSKFYEKQVENANYVALDNYTQLASAVIFDVSDHKLTMKSVFLKGDVNLNVEDGTVFDTFTIYKFKNYTPTCQHKTEVKNAKKSTYFKKGYSGDTVCTLCDEVITKGKSLPTLKLKKPTNPSYKVKGKKLAITYKQVKDANKFQIRYQVKGKKKTIKVKNFGAKSKKKVTKYLKLKKGKYTVQVRAMKSGGKATLAFSKWTKKKTIRVK